MVAGLTTNLNRVLELLQPVLGRILDRRAVREQHRRDRFNVQEAAGRRDFDDLLRQQGRSRHVGVAVLKSVFQSLQKRRLSGMGIDGPAPRGALLHDVIMQTRTRLGNEGSSDGVHLKPHRFSEMLVAKRSVIARTPSLSQTSLALCGIAIGLGRELRLAKVTKLLVGALLHKRTRVPARLPPKSSYALSDSLVTRTLTHHRPLQQA